MENAYKTYSAPEPAKPRRKRNKPRRESRVGKAFRSILDGSILTRENAIRLLPYVLFLTLLCILYIANSYYAEKTIIKTNKIKHQLQDLENQYISSKSIEMMYSRRTEVAAMLDSTGIVESLTPPKKIIVKKNQTKK